MKSTLVSSLREDYRFDDRKRVGEVRGDVGATG
jgi:hypothetical protein